MSADARPDPAPGDPDDPIEIWGKRIGRVVSVFLTAALIWWLGAQLGWF